MVAKMSRSEAEVWAYRADVAEQAIRNRHATSLWSLPHTNLAVPSWPAPRSHRLFLTWHYWWQAHYLDCLVDAALRVPSQEKLQVVRRTVRGIRRRNLSPLSSNKYFDDRAWMALALQRVDRVQRRRRSSRSTHKLITALSNGRDETFGVLPWRHGEPFFNAPSNGPAAIALARAGRVDEAIELTQWMFRNLRQEIPGHDADEPTLLIDGLRRTNGETTRVTAIYSYNQGVAIGACVEIGHQLLQRNEPQRAAYYFEQASDLIHVVARDLASADSVIPGCGGGDGGLFNGILARYLADAAVRLPQNDPAGRAAARIARRMVLKSGEAAWMHRLEVDGLPLFPADWTKDAQFPYGKGTVAAKKQGAVHGSEIHERDLSVQLSGWMLMEAGSRVAQDAHRRTILNGSLE